MKRGRWSNNPERKSKRLPLRPSAAMAKQPRVAKAKRNPKPTASRPLANPTWSRPLRLQCPKRSASTALQARPGATTRPLNTPAAPPAHQPARLAQDCGHRRFCRPRHLAAQTGPTGRGDALGFDGRKQPQTVTEAAADSFRPGPSCERCRFTCAQSYGAACCAGFMKVCCFSAW